MRVRNRLAWALSALTLASLPLGGCSAVDQFSSRAETYNDQAETIKEQQFLVNILRSAYREPVQFSDFTQVTGQASVSGSANFTLPISTFPANLSRTYTASPGATVSGTQSFSVVNLDTQAFYEGILAPIPLTSIDYYMEADYPKALLLTLFVSHIELKPQGIVGHDHGFYNSYYGDYGRFEAVLQAAIDLGLTTEAVNGSKDVGPPMTAAQLPEVKDLATIIGTGVSLKTYQLTAKGETPRDPELSQAEFAAYAREDVPEYYRLVRKAAVNRFCFAGDTAVNMPLVNQELEAAGVLVPGTSIAGVKFPAAAVCGAGANAAASADTGDGDNSDGGPGVEIDVNRGGVVVPETFRVAVTTRSVEEILYYLGEWTRAELKLGGVSSPPPLVRANTGEQDALFVVRRNCDAALPSVEASYFGGAYCIEVDPSGKDRSVEVMAIVSQLFALNNSAQNLPSPNVISVLSP